MTVEQIVKEMRNKKVFDVLTEREKASVAESVLKVATMADADPLHLLHQVERALLVTQQEDRDG